LESCAYYYRPYPSEQPASRSEERLRKAALAQGYQIAEGLGIVDGGPGGRVDRPGLRLLLAAVRKRSIAAVVCSTLDDLGRDSMELANSVATIHSAGIRIIVVEQELDIAGTPSAEGRLLCSALQAASQYERDMVRERIRRGMADAQARGSRIGRPPGRAPDADTVERLRKEGKSWDEIAILLGCSATTARRAMASAKKR
jgi:DNA invertase Pin-like site-specific DNA recombinase